MSLDSISEHVRPSHISPAAKTPPFRRVRVVRRIASWNVQTQKTGLGPTKTTDGTRRVTFSNEDDTRYVIRREDMTETDFSCIWYCASDFKAMKRDYMLTLKKMSKELQLGRDEEPRGLEHKTPKGNKKRQKNRLVSIDAVLREQDRQWERNLVDQGFISVLYIQASAHCRLEASLKANEDEEYVRRYVLEASSHDLIQECGGSKLSLGWKPIIRSTDVMDDRSGCPDTSLEAPRICIGGEQSYMEVERKPTCIMLAVA